MRLQIEVIVRRGAIAESRHSFLAAVCDAAGRSVAGTDGLGTVTTFRSAAKPFQLLPLVERGHADHIGLSEEELAIMVGSHTGSPYHVGLVKRLLDRMGLADAHLACGYHDPLDPESQAYLAAHPESRTRIYNNCSGKHAGMLALALHHGWPIEGYNTLAHPVQERILTEVTRWTLVDRDDVFCAVDGCNTVCFGVPLRGMATAYAGLATSEEPAAARLREAMTGHPDMVGGRARPCTDLMAAFGSRLIAKIGAEGVYSAALPEHGLGISLKAEDGDMRSAPIALVAVLALLLDRLGDGSGSVALESSGHHNRLAIRNTRGLVTGVLRAVGDLRFL